MQPRWRRGQLVAVVCPEHDRIPGTPWESGEPWVGRIESCRFGQAAVCCLGNGSGYIVPEACLVDLAEYMVGQYEITSLRETKPTPKRTSRSPPFTAADRIRAHGLGVRL
jgi:hypothetical protein